jgi:hypothetical protein
MTEIHIFISYAHEDKRWFEPGSLIPRMTQFLEAHENAKVWYDTRRLRGGDPWFDDVTDASTVRTSRSCS